MNTTLPKWYGILSMPNGDLVAFISDEALETGIPDYKLNLDTEYFELIIR